MIAHQEEIQEQKSKSLANQDTLFTLAMGSKANQEFNNILIKEFQDMKGTAEEKIKRLFNRLQKFFLKDSVKTMNIKDGYFCKRREPFYVEYQKAGKVSVVDNEIILFGIDFTKNREIIKSYQPDQFCPVDMSHVKLIYQNFTKAMQALRRNKRDDVLENEVKLEAEKEPPKGWMQMKPYYVSNYERRVIARFATPEEFQINQHCQLESKVPQQAKKIYNSKKMSHGITEKCQQRLLYQNLGEEKLANMKFQMSRRGKPKIEEQLMSNEDKSEISCSVNIGKGREQSPSENGHNRSFHVPRQRSRDKQFYKNPDCSRDSSLSNITIDMKQKNFDEKSVVSDASFILNHNSQYQQIFKDMATRLGLISMAQQLPNMADRFTSQISYSLTQNMPNQPDQESSFSIQRGNIFHYSEYLENEERKKQEEIQYIQLD